MYNAEHHYGLGLLSSVLECFPGKALHHGSDTAGVVIVACHKSSCSLLDSFYLLDVVCSVWIPYCGCLFLAALCWTASTFLMLSVVSGSHTVAAYSS